MATKAGEKVRRRTEKGSKKAMKVAATAIVWAWDKGGHPRVAARLGMCRLWYVIN